MINMTHLQSMTKKQLIAYIGQLEKNHQTKPGKNNHFELEYRKWFQVAERINSSVIITDINGNIEYVNKRFSEISGYSFEEVRNKNPRLFKSGKVNQSVYKDLWDTILSGNDWSGELQNRSKSGNLLWENAIISPIKDPKGEITHFLAIKEDITEKKLNSEKQSELEEQLRSAQKMEAIRTLAGGIAHDFNNILAAILGYSEITMDDMPAGSIQQKNMKAIYAAGIRAKELVNQILTFSRQSEHEIKLIKVDSLIKETVKFLRSSIPTSIKIIEKINPENPMVLVDPSHIHQIVMNLCSNAYQAIGDNNGSIFITLENEKLKKENAYNLSEGLYIKLSIRDTGKGVDALTKERIFDPFFTTKPIGDGVGLGLSVVHGIVNSLNGTVLVNSKLGEGSTFTVYLPGQSVEKSKSEQENPVIVGGNENILLVDDDKAVAEMSKQMLESLGYNVCVQYGGMETLEVFRKKPFDYDIIISDQIMPNITGVNLSKKLLQIRPDIPIIITTGFYEKIDKKKIFRLGIKGYIEKPVIKKDIAALIRNLLNKNKERSS
jgi:PAS domain S-box-containing protein